MDTQNTQAQTIRYQHLGVPVSQGTVDQISRDIQSGASQQFVNEFYAANPNWLDENERAQFQVEHPELVEQYSEYWQG